ncbi:MAG: TilS substrate-binding domain-containing protein, partial [Nevskiales bacterium]
MPRLRRHWPELAVVLGRSATLCAEAGELLDQQAEDELEWCAGPQRGSLLIPALRRLEPARRRNLLRAWLGWLGLPLPEEQHLHRVDAELLDVAEDATPLLAWPGAELRRYRECLYAMSPLPEPDASWQAPWQATKPLSLPTGCGQLVAESVAAPSLR